MNVAIRIIAQPTDFWITHCAQVSDWRRRPSGAHYVIADAMHLRHGSAELGRYPRALEVGDDCRVRALGAERTAVVTRWHAAIFVLLNARTLDDSRATVCQAPWAYVGHRLQMGTRKDGPALAPQTTYEKTLSKCQRLRDRSETVPALG